MRLHLLLFLAAAVLLSSCGSSAPQGLTTPLSTRTHLAPATRPPARLHSAPPPGPPVGATQRVPAVGTTLVVTVTRVIDPVRGSGAKVPAGMGPVGVIVNVRNAGPSSYDSSYTSDFSLLYPGGHAMPVFAPAGVCKTLVQDFMNELGAGVTRTGCIAYLVPAEQNPTAVRLAPDGGTAGHSVSWAVR